MSMVLSNNNKQMVKKTKVNFLTCDDKCCHRFFLKINADSLNNGKVAIAKILKT